MFDVLPTQTAVEEGQFVQMQCLAALSSGAPIEFIKQGLASRDAGNNISFYAFKQGYALYALYAFDLIPSLLDGDYFEMAKTGPLSIELR